jgi:hypothetical protein
LIVGEATDVSTKVQMSTVLSCLCKNGDIEERFLHFTNISENRSAVSLFGHAKQVLIEFNCVSKLVAQTYDGAAVMAGQHVGLKAKLRNRRKQFFPTLILNY